MGNQVKFTEKYRTTFIATDFMEGTTILVPAATPTKIGEYQVQAGEAVALGFGVDANQESAVGRLYIELKDDTGTPAVESGKIRISIQSPQNRYIKTVYEARTEVTGASTTRNLMIPFPEMNEIVTEDKKIVIEFISDATDSLTVASCTMLIDATMYAVA
jgi:hypothetical protein